MNEISDTAQRVRDLSRLDQLTLYARVEADPRMKAARAALNAFNVSEAGRELDEACRGADWQAKMAALDEEIKDCYEAHGYNWATTRARVQREIIDGGL